ncbi:MAG: S24/S26 family peptidase [Clostridia bacterium]|nr:S24/S26 family peptidase [Clostridia bacterium]
MDKVFYSTAEISDVLQDVIENGGHVPIYVSGHSMNPFLKNGIDMVWLRACEPSDFKCGQILLFKRKDGSLILHRIRKVLPNNKLLMNGDAQTWCEEISQEQAMAVAYKFSRNEKDIFSDSLKFKTLNFFWYPTRAIRPIIFRLINVFK